MAKRFARRFERARQGGENFEAVIDAPWLTRALNLCLSVLCLARKTIILRKKALECFFWGNEFTLTAMADRMAYRFDGPEIALCAGL